MKTTPILDKYMNLQAAMRRAERELSGLNYCNQIYDVSVSLTHFNFFSLELKVKSSTVSLPVKDARELAEYILEITKGIENTHDIKKEILNREQ